MYDAKAIKSILDREDDYIADDIGGIYISNTVVNSWKLIPAHVAKRNEDKIMAHRLNCLANLYYFALFALGKDRFQTNPDLKHNLHYQLCMSVQKDGLKEVIEVPRDHYKSTIFSECFPMWRALPFTDADEKVIRLLGYGDVFIDWMKRAHNQDVRTLIISETITNAVKLGKKIGNHYVNSENFKHLFPEIIPDSSCTWRDDSLHHKRTPKGSSHGEGTYDFIGVGAALQSRHYDDLVEDDLVGRDAIKSEKVMNDTIEYHSLLVGVMDSHHGNGGRDNNEIVVGNRWSYKDLNAHIRKNEGKSFRFVTHSALGGCCALHPIGVPIFPEAFTREKLARWKQRLGAYLFSCQFLNSPLNPENCYFSKSNLRYYHFENDSFQVIRESTGKEIKKSRIKISHHVKDGDFEQDVLPRNLKRYMIIDPNHEGNDGRCRHAITITGIMENPQRIYLLDCWAESCPIGNFIETIFEMAIAWKLKEIHLETIAAQKYLKFHLEYYIRVHAGERPEIRNLKIVELKTPKTAGAKKMRIDSLAPIFERGEFWVNTAGMQEFEEEYEAYGNKNGLIDVLDTLGYGPSVWKFPEVDDDEVLISVAQRRRRFERAIEGSQRLV
jgi:hypothetical protein